MTPSQGLEVLNRVTYKPTIKVRGELVASPMGSHTDPWLAVTIEQTDGIDAGDLTPNFRNRADHRVNPLLLARMDHVEFLDYVFGRIVLPFEKHEAEEFFKVDGQRVYAPHAEVAP